MCEFPNMDNVCFSQLVQFNFHPGFMWINWLPTAKNNKLAYSSYLIGTCSRWLNACPEQRKPQKTVH